MRMSEAEFLNRLNKAFPEKVIFAEQSRLSEYLSLFVEIRRYARGAGVSSVQWLTGRGFIWKETGYIEPDMHSGDKCGLSPDPTAFELADYVFRTYPLAGEYQLTNKEDALLYQSASETVKKVLIDGGRTSVREDTVLVLETINLLKIWSSGLADDYYIGDPHRNLIAKQIFEVNGQALQIESTSNDSLVVIGQTDYKVCPACGYASETGIPLEHKNSRGYRCVNKEGNSAEYRLSHDFKTDVAKITFVTQEAADINVMLSVLYALLEGLSREMGIERTDIKGCLFYTSVDGCMIFSVVLYDAVAGGAGHVRRIVTADGQAFQRVLAKAISVVDNCDCDSSCYRCLRNYYNQKIHDNLNRNQASAFLHQWVGNMNPLPMETIE